MAITIPSLTRSNGTGSVTTGKSITGDGETSPIELVNDASSPGISKYYGTNGAGSKGFFDVPSGSVTLSNLNPLALGTAGPGTSTEVSRYDHVHPMPNAAAVGADPAGTASSAISTHVAASDPHPQYALESGLGALAFLSAVDTSDILNNAVTTGKIGDDQVTYGKIQNVSSASRLLGRGSAGGSGNVEELTLGSGLSLSGTVLSATGGGSITISEVTVDLGSTPRWSTRVEIPLTATVGQKVLMVASGEDGDEAEMDNLVCAARVSATDTIEAFITAVPGPVQGNRKFNITIG